MFLSRLLNIVSNDNLLPMCFTWKFLFKTSIINEYQIRFNERLRKWEDREFVIDYLEKCNNAIFLDKVLLTYDCRTSISHLSTEFHELDLILLFKEREKRFSYKYRFDTQYYYDYTAVVIVKNLIELYNNAPDMLADKLTIITNDKWTISIINNWKPEDNQNRRIKDSILSRDIESCVASIAEFDENNNRRKSVLAQSIRSKISNVLKGLRGAK